MKYRSLKIAVLFCSSVVAGCGYGESSHPRSVTQAAMQSASLQAPPPTLKPTPAEDTARYVAWMEKQGKPIRDAPHEDVSLRIGDWGFFYHGDRPVGSWTPLLDRTALDRSGHAVTETEHGDWHELLSANGLDAASALKRVAWLFSAGGLDPANLLPKEVARGKITAPTLTSKDGVITFQGWWQAFTDPPYRKRITITAAQPTTKIVLDNGRQE